jgi:hypothetical protein
MFIKTVISFPCAVMSVLCKDGGNKFVMSWWDTSLILYHNLCKLTVPFLWNFTSSMLALTVTHLELLYIAGEHFTKLEGWKGKQDMGRNM